MTVGGVMASGGARTRSGPPPDPNALRRDRGDDADWVVLPAGGRQGDPPVWPLTRSTVRETHLWREMWERPQATMWEQLGQELEVALYVRRLSEAEKRNSATNLSTLVRQMADALGLTIPGMRVNRWKIAGDETAAKRAERASGNTAPAPTSARDRLRVVADATGA